MKNVEKETISITDYFVTLPSSRYLMTALVVLGVASGIVYNLGKYPPLELVAKGFTDGVLLLILPALISAVAVKIMIRKTPFRRILATTLAGEAVYALAYFAGLGLAGVNPLYSQAAILFGAAVVFVIWYSIARIVFVLKYRSFVFAIIQLFFHMVFLFSSPLIQFGTEPIALAGKFYLSSLLLLIALGVFFFIINAPMKRRFGVGSTDALSLVISQWLYQDKNLEKTFESLGQNAKTLVVLHAFERKGDKVFFVAPYVHFGPFGNLGGSEFSALISSSLSKQHNAKTFVFHPTVTHDLNPVSSKELEKVLGACNETIKNAKYSDASVSLSMGKKDECAAEALCFGDSAFISLTRAPYVTEDVDFGLGLAMINEAEKNFAVAAVVDQHNSETGEVTSFQPGSEIGYRYMESVKAAAAGKQKGKKLMLGIGQSYPSSDCIGNAGIQVAIFSSSPEYVMIVVDSNGVTPQFRDKVISEVKEIGKSYGKEWHVAVFTTDTHQINMVKGVLNPLHDDKTVLNEIKTAVANAFFDMKEAKVFAAKKWFDIKVMGGKQSIEMASTINAVVSVAKIVGPLILIAGLGMVYLLVSKLG